MQQYTTSFTQSIVASTQSQSSVIAAEAATAQNAFKSTDNMLTVHNSQVNETLTATSNAINAHAVDQSSRIASVANALQSNTEAYSLSLSGLTEGVSGEVIAVNSSIGAVVEAASEALNGWVSANNTMAAVMSDMGYVPLVIDSFGVFISKYNLIFICTHP